MLLVSLFITALFTRTILYNMSCFIIYLWAFIAKPAMFHCQSWKYYVSYTCRVQHMGWNYHSLNFRCHLFGPLSLEVHGLASSRPSVGFLSTAEHFLYGYTNKIIATFAFKFSITYHTFRSCLPSLCYGYRGMPDLYTSSHHYSCNMFQLPQLICGNLCRPIIGGPLWNQRNSFHHWCSMKWSI